MNSSQRALREIIAAEVAKPCPTRITFYSEIDGETVEAGVDYRTFSIEIGEDHIAEVIMHKEAVAALRRTDQLRDD